MCAVPVVFGFERARGGGGGVDHSVLIPLPASVFTPANCPVPEAKEFGIRFDILLTNHHAEVVRSKPGRRI